MKLGELAFKLIIVVALSIVIFLQFRVNDSIVYVDAIKLVSGYRGMAEARRELEIKASSWKSNVDTLKMELEAKVNEYEKNKKSLNNRERQLNEELIQTKIAQYEDYRTMVSEKLQKEDQELTSKVLRQVNDYIKAYGERKGYSIIMAATQYGNIVYAEKTIDITDEVLTGLNNGDGK